MKRDEISAAWSRRLQRFAQSDMTVSALGATHPTLVLANQSEAINDSEQSGSLLDM